MLKKIIGTLIVLTYLAIPITSFAQEADKPAANEIKAQITAEDYLEVDKKGLFDASDSQLLPDENTPVIYKWNFNDGSPQKLGKEVLHTFTSTGEKQVALTIQQNSIIKDVQQNIFIYNKKALLITDKTDKEELKNIVNQAAINGTWLQVVSALNEESAFLTEEALVNNIAKETEFIKDVDMILFYTKSNIGLQAFSNFWQKVAPKEVYDIKNKILIKLTDSGLATSARLTEQSFNVIEPQFILVTNPFAFKAIFESKNISNLFDSLGQNLVEYKIVDERSKRPGYFIMSKLITSFVTKGLAPNTLYLILALPFITFIIAFSRQVIGISTFGVYAPTMLALAFMILGVTFGLSVLVIVVLISYLLRLIFQKVNLLYIPKVALLLSLISLSFLLIIWVIVFTETNVSIALAIFPMLVMSTISEKFISTQSEEGIKSAVFASLETTIVALIAYYFVTWTFIADSLMSTPEILLLPLLGNIILGKFTGLRLSEYFRFRGLLRGDTEE